MKDPSDKKILNIRESQRSCKTTLVVLDDEIQYQEVSLLHPYNSKL